MSSWRDKRRVMQRYDLTADMYEERYADEQRAKYVVALDRVNVAGKVVLDVGCGSGLFLVEVAVKAGFVVGADISRKLLLRAQGQVKSFGNAFVVLADADNLPFSEGAFETVFSFTVLQNMPKPSKTLGELKRVMSLGGELVVTGLKRVFGLDSFFNVVEGSGLRMVDFVDYEYLKCYVAFLGSSKSG